MSEPIYQYIRGQGWVVSPPHQTWYVKDCNGRDVICENRTPQDGERVLTIKVASQMINGVVNENLVAEWFRSRVLSDYSVCTEKLRDAYKLPYYILVPIKYV